MQVQFTLTGIDPAKQAKQLRTLATALESMSSTDQLELPLVDKEVVPLPTPQPEEETLDDLEEEAPKKVAKTKKELTLEDDLIPAFQSYAKDSRWKKTGQDGMDEARKILTRYKVKHVHHLPKEKWGEILETLKS